MCVCRVPFFSNSKRSQRRKVVIIVQLLLFHISRFRFLFSSYLSFVLFVLHLVLSLSFSISRSLARSFSVCTCVCYKIKTERTLEVFGLCQLRRCGFCVTTKILALTNNHFETMWITYESFVLVTNWVDGGCLCISEKLNHFPMFALLRTRYSQ